MRVPSHPTLIDRMLQARLKRLAPRQPVLLGCLHTVERRCGTPSCRCQHGGPKHRAQQLTYKHGGRSYSVYVPHDLVAEVRAWLLEHQRLKTLLHEIHLLSVARIRAHVPQKRRRQGRP